MPVWLSFDFFVLNETPRARAKALVSYGGKQSSVKRISSTVHERKESPVARNFVNNVSAMLIEPVCIIPITF